MNDIKVIAIAALGENTHFICEDDNLLWHISQDLRRLKELTSGYPIIMGRKTFTSIKRPLPNRFNIVLTRNKQLEIEPADNLVIVNSIEEAKEVAERWCIKNEKDRYFIFGGAQIYDLALNFTDELYLTLVKSDKFGNGSFPVYKDKFMEIDEKKSVLQYDEKEDVYYRWAHFVKVKNNVAEQALHI